MALTRKALKAMGLTDEQVDSIIEMHTETTDGLKADAQKYKDDAEKLASVQEELDALKTKGDGGWETKYNDEHAAFVAYKTDITNKQAAAAKESAVRAYYEGKGITGDKLTIAMMGSTEAMGTLELDGESIKDTSKLDELVNGAFASLVTSNESAASKATVNTGGNLGGTGGKAAPTSLRDALREKYDVN